MRKRERTIKIAYSNAYESRRFIPMTNAAGVIIGGIAESVT